MARKKITNAPQPEPGTSRASSNPDLPAKVKRAAGKPAGRTGTATLKVRPVQWGNTSAHPGDGPAFAAFLRSEGLDPKQRMGSAELETLAVKFSERPIHGHRRGGKHTIRGGSHRPNPENLRR